MKKILLLTGVAAIVMAVAQPVSAQATDTENLTISAVVAARASLTISTPTLTFPDSDPDAVPNISPTEGVVNVTARARTGSASVVTLTLNAATDLVSGGDTILISNVSWTAGGAGYVAGTLAVGSEVSVGSWTGPGNRAGTQTFAMVNSWAYATGNYTASATYTLTAP